MDSSQGVPNSLQAGSALDAAIAQLPVPVALLDRAGCLQSLNRCFVNRSGALLRDWQGRHAADLIGVDRQVFDGALGELALRADAIQEWEVVAIRSADEKSAVHARLFRLEGPAERQCFGLTLVDTPLSGDSDRTQAALRDSESQLRLATEAAEVGLWDVDEVRQTLYWPPRVKAMFGISGDVPVSMDDFFAGLHEEDRDRVSASYQAATDPIVERSTTSNTAPSGRKTEWCVGLLQKAAASSVPTGDAFASSALPSIFPSERRNRRPWPRASGNCGAE